MGKKGFTLIEVIASIAIVLLLSSLILSNLFDVDKDLRSQDFDNLMNEIKLSAEDYAGSNGTLLNSIYSSSSNAISTDDECECSTSKPNVTLTVLIEKGYLRGNEGTKSIIVDPRTNENITNDYYVSFCYTNDEQQLLRSKVCSVE